MRIVFAAATFSTFCLGQSSLMLSPGTTVPGGVVTMGLSLNAQAGSAPAGLQWSFAPSAGVTALSIVVSPAAAAAGKSIQCAGTAPALTCILFGINGVVIPDGPVAVVNATMAANAVSGTVGLSNALGASATADLIAVSATGAAIAVTVPVVSALNCTASGLVTGAATACTVTLSAPVSGGATVQLNSDAASLSVPASVSISPGSASAGFTATAGAVTADQNATITATLNGSSVIAGLALTAPAMSLTAVQCAPGTLMPHVQATCTATLSRVAPAGGATVSLRSSTLDLAVPISVLVPANAITATFAAVAGPFTAAQNAVVTASLAAISRTASLALVIPGALSTLACTPLSIYPGSTGSCTVTLTSAAASPSVVALASTNPGMMVPASVTVSSGATAATFGFTTSTALSGWVIVSASLGSIKRSVSFTLSAGGALSGSLEQPPAAVNLTAEGELDWAHWGLRSATDLNHKASGGSQIGAFSMIGTASAIRYENNPTAFGWTDGTPKGIVVAASDAVFAPGLGNGFRLTVPAGTTPLTLRVYVGARNGSARMVAHLSDGSAADYVDTSLVCDPDQTKLAAYTFTFKAASAGQTLTVTYTLDSTAGNVTLQAATLRR